MVLKGVPRLKLPVRDIVENDGEGLVADPGEFFGHKPTGIAIDVAALDLIRSRGGKFVEQGAMVDRLGGLKQRDARAI